MQHTTTLLTYDDYLTLPNDGKRYEIIQGELYMTPSPTTEHQKISLKLIRLIDDFAKRTNTGEVFHAPVDIVFSMTEVVQPDIVFVLNTRKEIITKRNIVAAPDLIIEILSESTAITDRTTKKALYEKNGVKEYWIVDPDAKTIECLVLKNNKFERCGLFSIADTYSSCLFSELKVVVKEIFPE
ncbi:MAG: Uma2 family endonuclease [Bacteroidota bacterium]|nr:Uma2 family endonuclease [Bacteroidota bacterium]